MHLTGYPSTPITVRPFSEPEIMKKSPAEQERMRAFNRRISSVRISVEHAFGQLKGRFLSLRVMGPHDNIQEIYRVMEALIILHNFCIEHNDRPEDIFDYVLILTSEEQDEGDDGDGDFGCEDIRGDANIPAHETEAWIKAEGYRRRLELLDLLFPI